MSNANRDTHRTRLLEAARTLLREREYGNISARDLVAASDTNLGSIGYHFGSKEALLNEAIGLALEDWAQAIGDAIRVDAGGGLPALMAGSMRAVLDEHESIRPYYLAFIEALARSARSPELREQLAAHYRRQRERIAGWILDALGEHALAAEDARHLASLLLATADGMLIQSFVDPDDTPGSADLARVAGALTGGASSNSAVRSSASASRGSTACAGSREEKR
jgi:AcrR family transcriptional regulator